MRLRLCRSHMHPYSPQHHLTHPLSLLKHVRSRIVAVKDVLRVLGLATYVQIRSEALCPCKEEAVTRRKHKWCSLHAHILDHEFVNSSAYLEEGMVQQVSTTKLLSQRSAQRQGDQVHDLDVSQLQHLLACRHSFGNLAVQPNAEMVRNAVLSQESSQGMQLPFLVLLGNLDACHLRRQHGDGVTKEDHSQKEAQHIEHALE
mmetsp:Transcript_20357/g.46730  ORF Transcript_20357/g.46730 Transcript_20357/m.46730 type:complete len:202 (-) Transcript_20357:1391-1996(-)